MNATHTNTASSDLSTLTNARLSLMEVAGRAQDAVAFFERQLKATVNPIYRAEFSKAVKGAQAEMDGACECIDILTTQIVSLQAA